MDFPTSLKLTWIFTLALAVKLLPEPGSGCHEIADDRALSTNPRGASDPNVTWKEPGMKFTLVPLSNLIESVLHFPGTDIESQILPSPCFVCVCARMVSKASQPACFLFRSETKFSSKTIFHRNPEARYNMS